MNASVLSSGQQSHHLRTRQRPGRHRARPAGQNILDYFEAEVLPRRGRLDQPGQMRRPRRGVGLVGYEMNFNRYFYKYMPTRPLAEIDAELASGQRSPPCCRGGGVTSPVPVPELLADLRGLIEDARSGGACRECRPDPRLPAYRQRLLAENLIDGRGEGQKILRQSAHGARVRQRPLLGADADGPVCRAIWTSGFSTLLQELTRAISCCCCPRPARP